MSDSKLLKGSIDLMKIKKEHIFEGKNGSKWVNLDIWINSEKDQYDNDAGIKQSYKVGDDFESHYIGNGKKGFGWEAVASIEDAEILSESKEGEPTNQLPF